MTYDIAEYKACLEALKEHNSSYQYFFSDILGCNNSYLLLDGGGNWVLNPSNISNLTIVGVSEDDCSEIKTHLSTCKPKELLGSFNAINKIRSLDCDMICGEVGYEYDEVLRQEDYTCLSYDNGSTYDCKQYLYIGQEGSCHNYVNYSRVLIRRENPFYDNNIWRSIEESLMRNETSCPSNDPPSLDDFCADNYMLWVGVGASAFLIGAVGVVLCSSDQFRAAMKSSFA